MVTPASDRTGTDAPNRALQGTTRNPVSHYAIGDVHGCADQLRTALRNNGLIDAAENWTGGTAHVHFLGDLTDRGPDGVGVIDLVRKLQQQAPYSGGVVDCVLGNHEVILLAAHRFRSHLFSADAERFRERWLANGGRESDSERLTDDHLEWLSSLPAAVVIDEHLLLHADSNGYLVYGDNVETINDTVRAVLEDTTDIDAWDQCAHLLTNRLAFADDDGETVCVFLETLGARQLVHGHSPVPLLLGIEPGSVTGPLIYAGGRAVNMDTGTFLGGPCLVNSLPSIPPGPLRTSAGEPAEDNDAPTETLPAVPG